MKLTYKIFLLFLMSTLFLVACGGNDTAATPELSGTGAVETLVASFFATQTAMYTPPPTNTNTSTPTNTALPTPTTPSNTPPPLATWTPVIVYASSTANLALTPSVTGTPPTATQNTGALGFGCNNLAIVRDVNYPSGTTVKAGEVITKTWKVQNTGSCDWQYNYALVIISDEYFNSGWSRLGKDVAPGSWSEISVTLGMPNHDGTFTGSWRLADAGGNAFGATLSVSIVVVE
ncbi:MAG TPA: NBR1-Ig-like domain-containing protein [Anaerolineales bacterium]|nr:NBR1-Ig-like domain-containing protein [Anaerolineales bacterium]